MLRTKVDSEILEVTQTVQLLFAFQFVMQIWRQFTNTPQDGFFVFPGIEIDVSLPNTHSASQDQLCPQGLLFLNPTTFPSITEGKKTDIHAFA